MQTAKLHSPVPYFLLTALMGLVPVLNNKYPASFFPALSPGLVELLSVALGVFAAVMGFMRLWNRLVQRDKARRLIRKAVENRHIPEKPDPNDVINAGRIISRLVRNADEDLREIVPDFTPVSLKRLQDYLPVLMTEIDREEEARIRMGVAGVYLGETLCRNNGWKWFFKSDPALKQFSYLISVLRKGDKEIDPFHWAAGAMTGQRRLTDILKKEN